MNLFNSFHRVSYAFKCLATTALITLSVPVIAVDNTNQGALVSSGLQLGTLEDRDAPTVASEPVSQLPSLQYHNGIPYITGGIGRDEATVFKEQRRKFPLSMNFGQEIGDRTAYVADVQVVIRDANDQTIFNINSEGPYCLVDLKPGEYKVYVTYVGNTESRHFIIKQGEPVEINIRWPSDLSDGSIKSLKEELKEELL